LVGLDLIELGERLSVAPGVLGDDRPEDVGVAIGRIGLHREVERRRRLVLQVLHLDRADLAPAGRCGGAVQEPALVGQGLGGRRPVWVGAAGFGGWSWRTWS